MGAGAAWVAIAAIEEEPAGARSTGGARGRWGAECFERRRGRQRGSRQLWLVLRPPLLLFPAEEEGSGSPPRPASSKEPQPTAALQPPARIAPSSPSYYCYLLLRPRPPNVRMGLLSAS